MSQAPLNLKTWMTLGRVSNLPTVWTNTLAAALLASSAGALAPPSSLVWLPAAGRSVAVVPGRHVVE